MAPALVSITIVVYFAVPIGMSIITSKGADRDIFLPQNRQSPWCCKTGAFLSDCPNDRFRTGRPDLAAFRQAKPIPHDFRMHSL
jgi:hypothetical protein